MLQQIKEYLYTHGFYIFLVYTPYSQWTQTALSVMFLNKLKRLYSINHFREEKGHTAKSHDSPEGKQSFLLEYFP